MLEIEWLEMARADLLGIVDYISDDGPDAAQKLKNDIENKAGKLVEFPQVGRVAESRALGSWLLGRITFLCIGKLRFQSKYYEYSILRSSGRHFRGR